MPKRSRDGTIIQPSHGKAVPHSAVAMSSCYASGDVHGNRMDTRHDQFVPHAVVPPGAGHVESMDSSSGLRFWNGLNSAPRSGNHGVERWKQTSLFGQTVAAEQAATENRARTVSSPNSSTPVSCFFCEVIIGAGHPVLLCSGCDHEYCSECVIQDYTGEGCVPYCHSCFAEKQRIRSPANGKC